MGIARLNCFCSKTSFLITIPFKRAIPMSQEDGVDRRTFYLTFIYGAWAAMATVLGLLGGVYLLWPPPLGKGDEWVEAGSLSQLKLNQPEQVVFRHNRFDGWKLSSEKATAW